MGNFVFLHLGAMEINCCLRTAVIRRGFFVSTFAEMTISKILIQLGRLLIPYLYITNELNIKFFFINIW